MYKCNQQEKFVTSNIHDIIVSKQDLVFFIVRKMYTTSCININNDTDR